jgi:hypothetical protein
MQRGTEGERYARIFRKAGAYLAKGDAARAVETLEAGRNLAASQGHDRMARLFSSEIERVQRAARPADK